MAINELSTFMNNYFQYLPYDMQQEIIKHCYKRPHPKYCYGDMVVFVLDQKPATSVTQTYSGPIGSYTGTERLNDASDVYCVMKNPVWRHYQWTWEYLIRELKSDGNGYFSTEFISRIRDNENRYLHDCGFILNEHQIGHYKRDVFEV